MKNDNQWLESSAQKKCHCHAGIDRYHWSAAHLIYCATQMKATGGG
ncbi:hypothetical protein yberc0001_29660 [Yersinia bercovieri ATCC 43970]|uniref:Uncharacterized protein n=1 Tax=Yersinia bercovieri ATCC 43970 TaxID=349968 RepID=A0ABM9Y0Q8_YERBE|nr:hypothetical protein yberc0001_29660 [Yersinia bercovieri ATCC 43970]